MSDAQPIRTAEPAAPDFSGRAVAFGVTWLSYGSYYLGRKWLGVAKVAIERSLGESALYGVETMYLATYAVGQGISANIGDRVGARRLVGFGMLVSAAACVAFGLSGAWVLFLAAMFVNGLAQATGWPGNVKAMGEWVPAEKRGATMGIWSTCYQVGGIAASWVAAQALETWGWRSSILVPAIGMGAVGLVVLALLEQGPLAKGTVIPGGTPAVLSLEEKAAELLARHRVLRSPVVWSYGACYFFIKLIRYSLLFWLPKYLNVALGYSPKEAGIFSTSFEIGGVFGAIALGMLSDRVKGVPRSVFAAGSLVALAAAFYLYLHVGGLGMVANFAAMALIGVLLYGPDALLSGAAAQDAGGPYAAALAAGMVNGLGSIGGIAQEGVTRTVSKLWGWDALFWVFLVLSILSAVSLVPTFKRRAG